MEHGTLVLAQGQVEQAGGGGTQNAVGFGGPVGRQQQAFVAGQDEQLQGRTVDLDDLARQVAEATKGGAVHAQDTVEAVFDAGEKAAEQHQGLMPRCRATIPEVMLW